MVCLKLQHSILSHQLNKGNTMPVNGDLTQVEVSDDAISFELICVFENQATVDFGTQAINEESCLAQKDPIVSTGDTTYSEQELSYQWNEGAGDAADAIVKAAAMSDELAGKTITMRVETNNSLGTNGTQYVFEGIVTAYRYQFVKGEVNKTYFTLKQTTVPVETLAAA